jgi:hypothetical protein
MAKKPKPNPKQGQLLKKSEVSSAYQRAMHFREGIRQPEPEPKTFRKDNKTIGYYRRPHGPERPLQD